MKIREASETDAEVWARMRSALWPDTKDDHPQEIAEYFSGESIDIEQAYIVEEAGEAVGFLELNIRNFAEGSRRSKVPYVEAWYINPANQGKGYGRALMDIAADWARARGFTELASDTEVVNERSIALHQQLGFEETERIVCFLKSLD